jgi:ribosome biogenesis protein Tsr3
MSKEITKIDVKKVTLAMKLYADLLSCFENGREAGIVLHLLAKDVVSKEDKEFWIRKILEATEATYNDSGVSFNIGG